MSNANKVMGDVLELVRDLPQAKRLLQVDRVKAIAEALGLEPAEFEFVRLNVSRWPDRANRHASEIRYGVDFGYGDRPDYQLYGATFNEVAKLLRYTPESCRVAFNVAARNRVDRTGKKQTRLGPCVITKFDSVIDPAEYPTMRRLSDREQDLQQVQSGPRLAKRAKGNKY